jgi:hypothetical protein
LEGAAGVTANERLWAYRHYLSAKESYLMKLGFEMLRTPLIAILFAAGLAGCDSLKEIHQHAMSVSFDRHKNENNPATATAPARAANTHRLDEGMNLPPDVRVFILEVMDKSGCNARQVAFTGPTPTKKVGENLWVVTTGPNCDSGTGQDPYLHQTAFLYDDYNQIIWWGYGGTEADAESAKSRFDQNGNRRMLQYDDLM